MNFNGMKQLMEHFTDIGIPSVDIRIMREHELLYSCRVNAQGDELYYAYSVSKPMTVTCAMQLVEKGVIRLDDPVSEFLPAFSELTVKQADGSVKPAEKTLTVWNLFTMTSGISYEPMNFAFDELKKRTDGRCPTVAAISELAKVPLAFEPGTRWMYGLSHDVLAAVVEAASGERYSEYVQNHLFAPLGMTRSSFGVPKGKICRQYEFNSDTKYARPFTDAESAQRRGFYVAGSEYESGGAGLTTCADDYVLFADAMACGGIGKTGNRILLPESVELLHTPQLSPAQAASMVWTQLNGYNYGLGVRTMINPEGTGAKSPVGEFGWGGAAGSYMLADTKNRLSVFYAQHMLNNLEPYTHPRIRDMLYTCMEA